MVHGKPWGAHLSLCPTTTAEASDLGCDDPRLPIPSHKILVNKGQAALGGGPGLSYR